MTLGEGVKYCLDLRDVIYDNIQHQLSVKLFLKLFRDDPVYIKYYMNVTRTVLMGILPFAALIFFNIKIYMRFLVTRGRYARPNSHNSSQVSSRLHTK